MPIAIRFDADTFAENAGRPYFLKAQQIANIAQTVVIQVGLIMVKTTDSC